MLGAAEQECQLYYYVRQAGRLRTLDRPRRSSDV